jgi:pyruvate,water dikinase
MRFIRSFDTIESGDEPHVGGKGLSLGLLTRAGLPVPPGFCITTAAYRYAGAGGNDPAALSEPLQSQVVEAYERLGGGLVAVRSSAIGEDGEVASFAGQQETLLGVHGAQAVADAVRTCWHSLNTERARAYRQRQETNGDLGDLGDLAMAVVVQRLVEAEVSGVLFTRDPLDPHGQQMLVESAWGLGEGVVSGRVMPDRFHLRRDSGDILKEEISTKEVESTLAGIRPVDEERQRQACLDPERLRELLKLGHRIEQYYGGPRDIEWAWAGGQFWILQARPITTAGAFEREEVRRREIGMLRQRADPKGTVWARYNLAEILPTPTPMTWAIVRRFMSGKGGYGLMLRDLGFDPDPRLDDEGFIDLICGRPYVNLSREPGLYFRDFPAGHSFAVLKANPEKAFYPQPTPDSDRVTARFLFRVPIIFFRMLRNAARMRRQAKVFAEHLRQTAFPRFREEVKQAETESLETKADLELLTYLCHWIDRTLNEFARESLRPSVFAGVALGALEVAAKRTMPAEEAAGLVRGLLAGVRPDPDADLAGALSDLALGRRELEQVLPMLGHRGPQEMELAEPRWGERPELLRESLRDAGAVAHQVESESPEAIWQRFVETAKLDAKRARSLRADFERARDYSALRETGKHHLMMGYALIRRALLEFDRRHELRGGIFFLGPNELPRLVQGENFRELIARRKEQRTLALGLEAPAVIFSDDLDAIGRPIVINDAAELQGTPLSMGVAEGPALVLEEPTAQVAQRAEPAQSEFILVCPSTDPAWVPLFLRAKGLVMETGGVLSHGAIVAREFGLPAVAGFPGILQRIHTGQRVRVDGNTGRVHIYD